MGEATTDPVCLPPVARIPKLLQGIAFLASRERSVGKLRARYGSTFTLDLPMFGQTVVNSDRALIKELFTMSTDLILGLVRQNLAVALLAPDVALGEDLRLIPVTDGPTRVQYLAWSSFNPSPATRAFLAVVPKR